MRIHLCNPGRQTDMYNRPWDLSPQDLAKSAQAYDPKLHEAPLVIGHPTQTAPSYGWVGELAFSEGNGLEAVPSEVDATFEPLMQTAYKKRSPRFYHPQNPRNPVPGVFYLRDIGFLGAQAPAIKGLRDVAFAEEPGELIELVSFAETSDWTLATIFRGLRDVLIDMAGMDRANQAIPEWLLDDMIRFSLMPSTDPDEQIDAPFSEPMGNPKTQDLEANLAEREAAIASREAALAESEAAAQRRDFAAFAESLSSKIHPSQVPLVVELLSSIAPATQDVAFAEGDAISVVDGLKKLLTGLPDIPELAALGGDQDVAFAEGDPTATANKIRAYQAEQKALGRTVSPTEALGHIKSGRA